MKNYKRGFIIQGVIAIIALVLIASGAYYVSKKEVVAPEDHQVDLDQAFLHYARELEGSDTLLLMNALQIAQKVVIEDLKVNASKECIEFDGIRENGSVVYTVWIKPNTPGCLVTDGKAIPKIKVDLKTGEAFSGTLDGGVENRGNIKEYHNCCS